MKIEKLYTYPVKGLRALEQDSAILTRHGFPYDRRYMLLEVLEDGSYKNMAIAHYPACSRYFPAINESGDGDALKGTITITYKPPHGEGEEKRIEIPLKPKVEGLREVDVVMHRSPTKAYDMGEEYNAWFRETFGFKCILVYLGNNMRRVLMTTSGNGQASGTPAGSWLSLMASKATQLVTGSGDDDDHKITFADVAPYLVVSSKSMEDVSSRFSEQKDQIDIIKFRPNIIVSGAEKVWEEDYWAELTISPGSDDEKKIICEHNCGRCKSLNIDYETGKPGEGEAGNLLKKLSSDRRVDEGCKWSPVFGRYSFLDRGSEGKIVRVGEEVVVSRRNEGMTAFGTLHSECRRWLGEAVLTMSCRLGRLNDVEEVRRMHFLFDAAHHRQRSLPYPSILTQPHLLVQQSRTHILPAGKRGFPPRPALPHLLQSLQSSHSIPHLLQQQLHQFPILPHSSAD